jgi:hypothetical protein
MLDLYVSYDESLIVELLHNYTTFQTPFGALLLVTLPMGWTSSVPIFHNNVTFILQAKIPHITIPYVDNVLVKGPKLMVLLTLFQKTLVSINLGTLRKPQLSGSENKVL